MKKQRIKDLEQIIIKLDTLFEQGEDCVNPISGEIILDNEYDFLKKELFELCPNSKIFSNVTASELKITKDKIKHNPPMTSINKCNGTQKEKEEILEKFFKDCGKLEKDISARKNLMWWIENFFSMSYKHDGIALSCEYENGELKRAGLRSDTGMDGIDVTEKTMYISGVPQTLNQPVTCKIRGEVETTVSEFKKQCDRLGEDAKANERSHSAGSMNLKTAIEMKDRGLRFTAYNVVDIISPPYKTEIERAKWVSKLGFNFVETIPFTYELLKTFEEEHRKLDFKVDGVVISINDLELQEKMGRSGNKITGNKRGKIAFKFADEIKKATVKNIVWQTGRTGTITPVLVIEPVQLEGTQVQRVTAHNLKLILNNNIGINSKIEIIKSGKIIPKIHKVIEAKGNVEWPSNCSSCGEKTEIKDGKNNTQSLICPNRDNCPAQNVKNLNHWLKCLDVKGIAEKNIEKLMDMKILEKPGDFYRLTVNNLVSAGVTERTAILIVARVWMINSPENIKDNNLLIKEIKERQDAGKIKVGIGKFFAAFGMPSAGKLAGEILEKEIEDWKKIKTSTISELEVFDSIGPTMAQEIVQFFKTNKEMVEDVEQYFEFEAKTVGGKLEGKTFVLSGKLKNGKAYWKQKIEEKGGVIKSSVSKNTSFLLAGDGSGLKTKKAKDLKITILTTEELEKLLNN